MGTDNMDFSCTATGWHWKPPTGEKIEVTPSEIRIEGEFKMKDERTTNYNYVPNCEGGFVTSRAYVIGDQKYKTTKELAAEWAHDTVRLFEEALEKLKKHVYPTKIIYNPPYTICYFGDDKEIVKCSEFDEFKPDFGVMACIMRRMFSTRAEFDRLVESGSWQEPKEKKNK